MVSYPVLPKPAMTQPQRVEHLATDKGSVPVYATGIVEQPWDNYTTTDHGVWQTLFRRQREILQGRACDEFLQCQDAMGIGEDGIPKFSELNVQLGAATGWQLIGVEGLLPELDFFEHLANRRFPVTWWIRRPEQLDYLSEPDLFHDLFGQDALAQLTRLYWYTVEFGLIDTPKGLRIYGSGIVSSSGESVHCLESDAPNRIGFDLLRVMRTRYRIDTYQKTYFVIRDFEQLFEATRPDFCPYYEQLAQQPTIPAGNVLDTDRVYHRGSGEGWLQDGDV